MSDEHPARFLLLPYAHHAAWFLRQRLPLATSFQHQRVSHDERIAVHLGIDVTKTVIVDLERLESLQRSRAVVHAVRIDRSKVRSDVALQFGPVFRFHFFPEIPLQRLTASGLRPIAGVRALLGPKRAGCERQRSTEQCEERGPKFHSAILSQLPGAIVPPAAGVQLGMLPG